MAVVTTTDAFLDQLIRVVNDQSAVTFAKRAPVKQVGSSIWSLIFVEEGRAEFLPAGSVTFWDNIKIIVATPEKGSDWDKVDALVLPVMRKLIVAVYQALRSGDVTPLNMGDISYQYGPFEWAGTNQYGALITLQEVKTMENLT